MPYSRHRIRRQRLLNYSDAWKRWLLSGAGWGMKDFELRKQVGNYLPRITSNNQQNQQNQQRQAKTIKDHQRSFKLSYLCSGIKKNNAGRGIRHIHKDTQRRILIPKRFFDLLNITRCESPHDTSSSLSRHVIKRQWTMDNVGADASKRQYQGHSDALMRQYQSHSDARKRRLLALSGFQPYLTNKIN